MGINLPATNQKNDEELPTTSEDTEPRRAVESILEASDLLNSVLRLMLERRSSIVLAWASILIIRVYLCVTIFPAIRLRHAVVFKANPTPLHAIWYRLLVELRSI